MTLADASAFTSLFRDAYKKCFGHALQTSLSETESKLFCNQILEHTGLVIGSKSMKNYSVYIVNNTPDKQENPSIATLDTLARYVLAAPYTDEITRKNKESHYPYWFQYKEQYYRSVQKTSPPETKPARRRDLFLKRKRLAIGIVVPALITLIIILLISIGAFQSSKAEEFTDNFHSVSEDSLNGRGWFVHSKDIEYWNRRGEKQGYLTLFTLRGDNWPDSMEAPLIKNLLLRKIPSNCFIAEIHLSNFIPHQNWQQAGIILLEDMAFIGKSVRLSLAYNDFFGGAPASREILIQAITSLGKDFNKPEEIAHQVIFSLDSTKENLARMNLQNSALRIEKQGKKLRFLFANSSMENSAFKELVSQDFDMQPKYIGIFALKGFVNDADNLPAYFKHFSLVPTSCDK